MPIISGSDFQPAGKFRHGHFSTIYPYIFGKIPNVQLERLRLNTPDGDFLDIDVQLNKKVQLVILCHGLEGSSKSGYMRLFAGHFLNHGLDVIALNYRGCSGEMNRKLQMYNSGSTGDLDFVISKFGNAYQEIVLVGFSLGGNIVLKYAGEGKFELSNKINKIIAISTPMHLADASKQLLKKQNILYQLKFLYGLIGKIIKKKKQFPDQVDLSKLRKTTNLFKFDDYYTAPIFGYKNADDYYNQNMSLQWLDQIRIPSLIINAKNDPFLGPLSYPADLVSQLENVYLCIPEFGGHVSFANSNGDRSWLFSKVDQFIKSNEYYDLNF